MSKGGSHSDGGKDGGKAGGGGGKESAGWPSKTGNPSGSGRDNADPKEPKK
jgi:hypothetical protein